MNWLKYTTISVTNKYRYMNTIECKLKKNYLLLKTPPGFYIVSFLVITNC